MKRIRCLFGRHVFFGTGTNPDERQIIDVTCKYCGVEATILFDEDTIQQMERQ